jgi:hypothetical protein
MIGVRPPTPDEERVVRNIAGRCNGMTFDAATRLVEVQVSGYGGDPVAADPALRPQTIPGMPVVFPYGFLSLLPTGDAFEVTVLETASGVVGVSMRNALPSGIPAPAEGDSLQYSSGGSYSHHDADSDTVHEPNSGKVIKLGSGATEFAAKGDSTDARIKTLRDEFDAFVTTVYNVHNHPTAPPGPVSTPSVPGSSPTAPTSVKASKVKVE